MELKGRYFPNKLRRYRKLSGYTRRQVAWLLGQKTTSQLSRWECGLGKPSIDNLLKLSVIYNTLMEELYSNSFKPLKVEVKNRIKRLNTIDNL